MQTTKLIFVSANSGTSQKSGRPYNIITLSNGIRAGVVNNPNNLHTDDFDEGDEVIAGFDVDLNYNNEWTLKLVSLEPA